MDAVFEPELPDDGDVSIAWKLLLIAWPLYGAAALLIFLRLIAKLKIHQPFALEDFLVTCALLFGVGHISMNTWGITYGLGVHMWYLTESERMQAIKAEFFGEPFGIISPTLGRISFAVYLLGLINGCSSKRRWFLYFLILQNVLINAITLVLVFSECDELSYNWDHLDHASQCWDVKIQRNIGIAQGTSASFTDLALTILPVTIITSLHIRLHLKIGLSLLLGLSSFAMVASIIRTCLTVDSTSDETFRTVNFVVWCAVENCTVIITSSIPFLRPLFRRHTKPYIEMKPGTASSTTIPLNTIEYRTSNDMFTLGDRKDISELDEKGNSVKVESYSNV